MIRNKTIFRQVFEEAFGLSSASLSKASEGLVEWGLDVRHLHFRKVITDPKNKQLI
jgi:hypothetical protein